MWLGGGLSETEVASKLKLYLSIDIIIQFSDIKIKILYTFYIY